MDDPRCMWRSCHDSPRPTMRRKAHSLGQHSGVPGPAGERWGSLLLVTTYQAGKLMAVRGNNSEDGRISTVAAASSVRWDWPCAAAGNSPWARGTLRSGSSATRPTSPPQIAPRRQTRRLLSLPRVSYVTGDIRCHEMAWVGDALWIVNTFFSHVPVYSRPRLQFRAAAATRHFLNPGPAPGDHCHLNGLAASADGKARYVTALGETRTPEGWRPRQG